MNVAFHFVSSVINVLYYLLATKCDKGHPYAFMWGKYCCKTPKESNANANLKGCDGSPISLHSTCCHENKNIPCANMRGCRDNRGKNMPSYTYFMCYSIYNNYNKYCFSVLTIK